MKKLMLALGIALLACGNAPAQIVAFDLLGKAGPGLLSGNENHAINGNPGTGGEVGAGITFDTATSALTLNIGWGSGNGFTNLTGNATVGHIHGITASPAPASFFENAGVQIGLDSLAGWINSASSGGFSGTVSLTPPQVTALFNGQLYINIHTSLNGPGEIRGNLVVVPEPTSLALAGLAAGGFALRLRRRAAR